MIKHFLYNTQRAWLYLKRSCWHVVHSILPFHKSCPTVFKTLNTDKDLEIAIQQQYQVVKLQNCPHARLRQTKILKWLRELQYNRRVYK